jgi:hypothetical protein
MPRKALVSLLTAAALALPAGALADHGGRGGGHDGEGHGGRQGKATVQLKGFLSAFTAPAGLQPGSVTIFVTRANRAGKPFVGMTLTFMLGPRTEIEPEDAVILDGDFGSVRVNAPPNVDAAHLQAFVPKEVEDEAFEEDDD